MKTGRYFFKLLPEMLLLSITVFYWNQTYLWNPVAIVLIVFTAFQLFTQFKLSGKILSGIFCFLSFWMFLAFLTDALKIETLNEKAKRFLVFGILLCGTLLIASGFMLVKYFWPLGSLSQNKDQVSDQEKQSA